jgi:hypothetical protein
MWETRLLRRQALDAVWGRGTIIALLALLLFSMLTWVIGGSDRETRLVFATSTGMRSAFRQGL